MQFTDKDELYAQLVNCDIIIYDITEHADQIEEATWIASRMLWCFFVTEDYYCYIVVLGIPDSDSILNKQATTDWSASMLMHCAAMIFYAIATGFVS